MLRNLIVVAMLIGAAVPAAAVQGQPPVSQAAGVPALDQVDVLELDAIDPEVLLAEDERSKAAGVVGPLRFASPVDLEVGPATRGTWHEISGGRVWRLRLNAPNATDLNLGFSTFDLAAGATVHLISEDHEYSQGPYTAADRSHAGDFWTPVVPGSRAVVELFEPAGAEAASELVIGRIGRGYRDQFGLDRDGVKAGSCNIDVICPEGDPWRDEIRSVGVYSKDGFLACTGTMIMNVPGDFTPLFLTAAHCDVRAGNASSVVVYWNFESPVCGGLCCGSRSDSQSGAIFRAARDDNDVCLLELEEAPDPAHNVYFAGWDARDDTAPQASVGIHHPSTDEKAISFNDDPLRTDDSCINSGGVDSHWWVDQWEQGTTEPGSSGSGLWDPATHLLVGYLSGGLAACGNQEHDCYGKMSVGWDGPSAETRLRDWLDPAGTGTRHMAGANAAATILLAGYDSSDSCTSGDGHDNGVWEPGETVEIVPTLSATGPFSGITGTLTSQTAGVTVVDGSARWPDLASGDSAASRAPHLTLEIGDGVSCGTEVRLQLEVQAAGAGPFTYQITQPVGASLVPNVPVGIPDLSTVSSELVVAQDVTLTDVNVRVEIEHTWVRDLVVTLRSPSGTVVTLLDRAGCGDNDMNVTFDDASSFSLENHCQGTTPWYAGVAAPHQPLAAFNGQSSAGTWTLTVDDQAGGDTGRIVDWELITTPALSATCQACGGGGGQPGQHTYLVAGIARAPGAAGTNWRSKLAVLNRSGASAQVAFTYVRTSKIQQQSVTLANGQLMAWDDVALSLFGISGTSAGAVMVSADEPLIVTARTYNVASTGTFGQFLPGVGESQGLSPGGTGVISQLVRNSEFRTNIGFVNLRNSQCQAQVTLRNTAGSAVGSRRTVTIPAMGWQQDNDIFVNAGAGTQQDAYATVEVLTPGCTVWGYGSVVDQRTGDPTTVPMVVE
jgi:subtilisin-like proprotein convertase family protein